MNKAKPTFGGRMMTDEYYNAVSAVIKTSRAANNSLTATAEELNTQGFTTPRGLPFSRDNLVGFIKSNLKSNLAAQKAPYYRTVNAAIKLGRDNYKTLREIGEQMNKDGLKTPLGMQWTKDHVARYLRSVAYKSDI